MHTEALNAHEEAVALFEEIGDKLGAVIAKLAYSSALGRMGRHAESLGLIEHLRRATDQRDNELLEADLLHNRSTQLMALRTGYLRSLELYSRQAGRVRDKIAGMGTPAG